MSNIMEINTGYEKAFIDYDPKKYKTIAGAAKGLYKALVKHAMEIGYSKESAESEIMILNPEQYEKHNGGGKAWYVCWEGWMYDWAINASWQISGDWGYTEPHYSFDLCFCEM